MTRSLVLIPRDGDRQFLTKEQAEELLAGVPDYVEPVVKPDVVEPVVPPKVKGSSGRKLFDTYGVLFDSSHVLIGSATQDYWAAHWNDGIPGSHFPDFGDFFEAWKLMMQNYYSRNESDRFVVNLSYNLIRQYFREEGMCLSNRFVYKKNLLAATIYHHYGSVERSLAGSCSNVIVPQCYGQDASLDKVLASVEGLDFMRILIRNNNYSAKEIADVLEFASDKHKSDILLRTPRIHDRLRGSRRVLVLDSNSTQFFIDCSMKLGRKSYSMGVHYLPKGGGASQ